MTPHPRLVMSLAAGALVAAGCRGRAPTEPGNGTALTLRTDDVANFQQSTLFLRLEKVENDSRCPINALCIWAGNAEVGIGVHVGVTPGPDAHYTLNTGIEPRSVAVSGYRITLDSLTPYPAGQPIPQTAYRAYVTVTFMPDR